MSKTFFFFCCLALLTACGQTGSNVSKLPKAGTTAGPGVTDGNTGHASSERVRFSTIAQVVKDTESNAWVDHPDTGTSLALRFNLYQGDTLGMSYDPSCWLLFPYKLERDKIVVYWACDVDSKYDSDLEKAVTRVERRYLGQPFMTLKLVNDTTLKAEYLLPGLIRKLNASVKSRTLFADAYVVEQDFYF